MNYVCNAEGTMRLLNFGSCNIDHVYSLESIVRSGETVSTYSLELFEGGKGLNQSIAAARAGMKVFHAGCIGEDGQMLRDIMQSSGVDLRYLKTVSERTGHAIIQVSRSGENCILLYGGANLAVTREYIDEVLSHFFEGDMLLLQNEISCVDYLVEAAHKKGMRVILNPSPFNEEIKKIDISKLSYLILNEHEAYALCGESEPEKIRQAILAMYPTLKTVLTLGRAGAVYFDADTQAAHPAFCVEAVDTTAAGDTFTGYFLASVAEGLSEKEALARASAASALAVSKKGAAPSIPIKNEVIAAEKILEPLEI